MDASTPASPASSCPRRSADPLRFRDTKRYTDRLKEAREKTHLDDAIVVGARHASTASAPWSRRWSSSFIGGSMGAAVGDGIVAAARLAVLQEAPLIVFTASGGARMQEGAISLMQMPRTVIATRLVKDAGLPFIVVLTDPTTGGVTASFADAGRHPDRRARRADRFRRRTRDRADRARKAARGVPARGVPACSTASSTWW